MNIIRMLYYFRW